MKIAADRAEKLFPGGFDLRVHVGDTVCFSSLLTNILNHAFLKMRNIFRTLEDCVKNLLTSSLHLYSKEGSENGYVE